MGSVLLDPSLPFGLVELIRGWMEQTPRLVPADEYPPGLSREYITAYEVGHVESTVVYDSSTYDERGRFRRPVKVAPFALVPLNILERSEGRALLAEVPLQPDADARPEGILDHPQPVASVSEWRSRFPMPPQASSYSVEGLPVGAESLRVRAMNFSQHWRTPGVIEVRYEVILPGAYAVALLEREWADLVDDCQRFPEPDDSLEQALRTLDWPEPARALGDPVAAPQVLDFFAHELLLRWFDDGSSVDPGFVLNSVEEARMVGTDVYLAGRARPHDPKVRYAYQDF